MYDEVAMHQHEHNYFNVCMDHSGISSMLYLLKLDGASEPLPCTAVLDTIGTNLSSCQQW